MNLFNKEGGIKCEQRKANSQIIYPVSRICASPSSSDQILVLIIERSFSVLKEQSLGRG